MENLVNITYAQTGASSNVDELGMREMQRIAYSQRHRKYLLVKAPPACGKSRAMMFVALDKLANQASRRLLWPYLKRPLVVHSTTPTLNPMDSLLIGMWLHISTFVILQMRLRRGSVLWSS